jgi:hypothetical protein
MLSGWTGQTGHAHNRNLRRLPLPSIAARACGHPEDVGFSIVAVFLARPVPAPAASSIGLPRGAAALCLRILADFESVGDSAQPRILTLPQRG